MKLANVGNDIDLIKDIIEAYLEKSKLLAKLKIEGE